MCGAASCSASVFSEDHNGLTFVDLLNVIDTCYPTGRGHIVCDNLSAHDTDDVLDWFEDTALDAPLHPRSTASWMNQIECAFSILDRRVLARGSFMSKDELREKNVTAYMLWHNETERPFHSTYRPKSWSTNPGHTCGNPALAELQAPGLVEALPVADHDLEDLAQGLGLDPGLEGVVEGRLHLGRRIVGDADVELLPLFSSSPFTSLALLWKQR